jgi:hypothetical protein
MTLHLRGLAAAVVVLALAGCSGGEESATRESASKLPNAAATNVSASLLQPDCYTVYIHGGVTYKRPGREVPADRRAYLGQWGGGAWGGTVCHDLWITDVGAPNDGATVIDAHGPGLYPDATAFRRPGYFDQDGRLHVKKGREEVEYWIEDGLMHGIRRVGGQTIRIVMERRDTP